MAFTYYVICLLLDFSENACPDGNGGHGNDHGHLAEHAAAPPSSGYVEPAPASSYAAPAASYSSASTSYGAPDAGYGAPDAGYGAPSTGYGAPDAGYGAPDAGYGAPDTGYGAPDYGYGAPSAGYGEAESVGGGGIAGTGLPFASIIIPIMIIAGLALLFPSTVTVPVGRKKRSAGE